MEYLVKNKKLPLIYAPGKGAWTYHIQIPNTKHIIGKWGFLKASGTIDDYPINNINLFTIKGNDKLIAINSTIRKAIYKTGGDAVMVTLYLSQSPKQNILTEQIVASFEDAGVLNAFKKLSKPEQQSIIKKITTGVTDEQQVKLILKYIQQLT